MHIGPPNPKRCSKKSIFKNPRWRTAAILKNIISTTVWPFLMKFCMMSHISHPELISCSKSQTFKNPTWQMAKNVKRDFSATVWSILVKFGMAMHIRPHNLMVDQKFKNLKIQYSRYWQSWKSKIALSPKPLGHFDKICMAMHVSCFNRIGD